MHEGYRWWSSPDSSRWFGLKNGPAVESYDLAKGKITRLSATNRDKPWWSTGTWLGDHFYIYGSQGGSARLWALSAQSTDLSSGIALPEMGQLPGCSDEALLTDIVATRDRLVVYEMFGSKMDRRSRCENLPGGAWTLDPVTGYATPFVVSTLHFSQLIPNRAGSELYGITAAAPGTEDPVDLVRIDARTGGVLQTRRLGSDYWRIVVAPLQVLPLDMASVALMPEVRR